MVAGHVVERVQVLLNKSLAYSSIKVYKRAWGLASEALALIYPNVDIHNLLPLSRNSVLYFIGYLSLKRLSSSTITTYVSAIGYVHKVSNFINPTTNFLVQKVLAAVNKVNPSSDSRLSITLHILHQLVLSVPHVISDHYQVVLLKAMFLFAFYGLMRVGEIAYSSSTRNPTITLDQITIFPTHLVIRITHFKHNPSRRPLEIVIKKQRDPTVCPLANLCNYMLLRGWGPGPLFVFQDGPVVVSSFFSSRLTMCINFLGIDPSLYKSHSFRIGAASLLASLRYSDSQIRLIGRWKGDAFKRYIRCERLLSCLS